VLLLAPQEGSDLAGEDELLNGCLVSSTLRCVVPDASSRQDRHHGSSCGARAGLAEARGVRARDILCRRNAVSYDPQPSTIQCSVLM
jgi:hypothetical protein